MAITLDDIVKLSPPKKLGILGCMLLIIFAGFWFLLISPEREKVRAKDSEYHKLKVDLDSKKQVAQDPEEFAAKLNRLRKHLEVMKTQLPDEKEIPSLLKTISSLGQGAGLSFQLFQPRSEIAKDFYAEIPVQIQVAGGYHEVGEFFFRVGMLDRIVNIANVSMGKPKDSDGRMMMTTSCLVTTFRFVEMAEANDEANKTKGAKNKTKTVKKKKKKR